MYDGASANLYNLGSAALIQGYYGINVGYGTITNAGTIASNLGGSGIALNFRSPGDSVVINPGAVFVGTVRAAGAIGNTLALASGSASGTLSGLTSQYQNFQSVTVATNATWRFDGSDVVGDGLALTNAGTINMAAGSYLNFGGGTLTNQATGVINGSMFYAATGIAISIDNAGLIDTNYGIDAVGRATVTNLGTMLADGPGVRTGYAVRALHGAVIVNGASGVTTAVMRSQAGIVVFAGADSSYNGYVTNFGTIAAIEANPAAIDLVRGGSITNGDPTDTVASLLGGNFGASVNGATVTNYGTITEFTANAGGAGVYASQQAAHIYNLGSSALIEGYVGIRASSGTITNAGTIASSQGTTGVAVQFAQAGDRLIMQPGGTFVGTVEAAGVGNTLELSSAATAGTLTGLAANYLHFQFVTVDASADWNFAYDAATTGVLLTNAGTINPLTDPGLIIAGGTLVNQTNGVIGDFGVAIAAGTVSNFGTIHATGSASGDAGVSAPVQAVVISNLGSLALIEGATGIIASYGTITNAGTIASTQGISGVAVQFGFAGDRMIIEPGATFVGSVQAAGGGNTLELASAATAGTLAGLAADFENFQSVTVDAGGYWNFDSTDAVGNGVVLSNAGTIVPLSIYELYLTGGRLDNQATGVIGGYGIYAERNFTSSIHNAGLINNSYGILLGGTGTVSNLGTVLAHGTAGGVGYTVHGFHGGTVVNGANGVTTAVMRGDGGIKFQNGPNASYNGYVTNFGTIAATGASGRGVDLEHGGTVANYGTISATAFNSNAAGVYGRVQAANISNLGCSALIEGYYGIISGAGTVTNGGTIASTRGPTGVAVQFRAPGDRLVIEPGARFIGTVAATGTVANTLALASGASIGTLSALGTEYANFQSVTVAANGYWVLADSDTIGAGVVLTNAGTINTVDGNNEYLAGGTLINQANGVIHGTGLYTSPGVSSSIDNIGLISNDYGVRLNGGSTVTNVGTILANANVGAAYGILGGHGGTVINGSTGVNTALIEGRAGIRILGGTDSSYNGTVTNFGTILSTAHYGVALDQGGTITNGGSNDTVALIQAPHYGVYHGGRHSHQLRHHQTPPSPASMVLGSTSRGKPHISSISAATP